MTTAVGEERSGRSGVRTPRLVAVDVPGPVAVAAWVVIVLPFVAQAIRIVRASWDWLSMQTTDDSFYYLEIARRIAAGEGSTFDGVNETNGYHPLWQGMTAVLASVFRTDRGLVVAALLLGLVLSAAALVLLVREIDLLLGRGPALAAGVVASSSFAVLRWSDGMEGPATLLALALLATAVRRSGAEPGSFARSLAVGAAAGLVVLSRLDYLLVVWIVPLVLLVADRRAGRHPFARTGGIAAGGALLLVPFGLWFLIRWGHPVTTSAAVKSHWMASYADEQFGGRLTTGYVRYLGQVSGDYVRYLLSSIGDRDASPMAGAIVAAVAAVGGLGLASGRLRPRWSPAHGAAVALTVVVLVVVAKAVVDVVLLPPFAVSWYAASTLMVVPLVLGALAWFGAGAVIAVSRPAGVAVAVLVAVIVVPSDLAGTFTSGEVRPDDRNWLSLRDSAAEWILAHGPPGRYGSFDAGLIGFRLDGTHEVVNLDGLVNDYEFADLVRADAPLDVLVRADEVDFVVNRLNREREDAIADCSEVLWESPGSVLAREGLGGEVLDRPVVVVDVRGCRDAG